MHLVHPDGTLLGATLTKGGDEGWVVIGGATGVPHRYYEKLAGWLAERHKVNVLSFDYRGVGSSRKGSLKGFDATYRDWASDFQVAVGYAAERGPTVVVGHSFGGHAFGMTEAHKQTLGLYSYATGAGWHGYMEGFESWRVWLMWNVLAPMFVAWKGYLPFKMLNMGEDLPLGVYKDWRKWCSSPQYFFDDPEADFRQRFAEVKVPVVAVNSSDDAWAPPVSAKTFFSYYPTASCVTVSPKDIGVSKIGHMSYVRPSCQALWEELGVWIEQRMASA